MIPSTDVIQLTLTLKMTTAQVVETSVTVNNSPIQDYVHPDDQTQPTRKASFVWELPFLHLSAHLEPAAGQRGQSFQICLHLRPPFLILREPTNDTADP